MIRSCRAAAAALTLGVLFVVPVEPARASPAPDADRAAIRRHLESIFDAYVRQDIEVIAATHSEDWRGFFSDSTALVRGLDAYLERARSSFRFPLVSWEIRDLDIALRDDIAQVYYVASWQNRDPESGRQWQVTARALDAYERRDGHWIQTGSNLSLIPRQGSFSEPACWSCFGVVPVSSGSPSEAPSRRPADLLPPTSGEEPTMYGLISKLEAKPGQREGLASILRRGVKGAPGCISYVVAEDLLDENGIWVSEVWESREAHSESLALDSVRGAIAEGGRLIAGFGQRVETRPLGGIGID